VGGDRRPWGPGELDASDLPQCLDCGTCCFSTLPEYLRVFGGDYDRMDDGARALTHFIGNKCFLRLEDGHCAALVVDAERRRFVCSIYEVRPDTCRSLERGSGACRGEIATKADRPLYAVEQLLARR
jgi:Fe-S-cluster containining protein